MVVALLETILIIYLACVFDFVSSEQLETAARGLAVVISTLRIRGSLRPGAGEGPR
jgi:hypothetical protein